MKLRLLTGIFTLLICGQLFGQTWETVASLPSEASDRNHPVTFAIAGVGYVVGGTKPTAGVLGDFYSYDPDADAWTTLPDFPGGARGFSYGVTDGSKGYVGFGLFENEVTFELTTYNDLWEFDPTTGDWTELASCPCEARFHPAMIYVNDKIFMGLGANEFGDLGDWWEYDIPTDTWTEKTDFPSTDRHHPYYFGIGDYAYVGFGHHSTQIFNDFYRYDPATDTWTTLSDFPEQGRVAGTQFSYFGKGYILSGQGETHNNLPTGEFWEYDPTTDEWVELDAHPGGGRWAPGSFRIDDKLFFTCGEAFSGDRKDMMVYQFETFSTIAEESTTESITLSPNPSQGLVRISNNVANYTTASVFDTAGRMITSASITNQQIDLSSLSPGIYFVQLSDGTDTVTEKLVIE